MVTFIELYEDYLNQRISAQVTEGTLKIYGYTARPFCEWADDNGFQPDTIERKQIRAYIAILTLSGRAKATVDLHGRNVRALLRYGHLEGVCPEVNFRGLLPRPPKRKQRVAR
ncbi:MAG: phage integrase N-terminal SAM-like domain-containing protein, partial [Anaerolineales bacterium]|nr:phage integrase N-terminal SAM-like domain-containing protein [Anaerolineales bacterium]